MLLPLPFAFAFAFPFALPYRAVLRVIQTSIRAVPFSRRHFVGVFCRVANCRRKMANE